jgi:hypothetical protein
VRRVSRNCRTDLLRQSHVAVHPDEAGQTFVRFCLNSSVGLAGRVRRGGHRPSAAAHRLGGTLYRYAPAGPYLGVPLLGPTTARDGLGRWSTRVRYRRTICCRPRCSLPADRERNHSARRGRLKRSRAATAPSTTPLRSAYYFNVSQVARRYRFRQSPRPCARARQPVEPVRSNTVVPALQGQLRHRSVDVVRKPAGSSAAGESDITSCVKVGGGAGAR